MSTPVTVLLVRHARSTANSEGILAGRMPGVTLDEKGREQAEELRLRLSEVPLTVAVSSPLERTVQTAETLVRGTGVPLRTDRRLTECDYGEWTGRSLKALSRRKLWSQVQSHPSAVRFPAGESMAEMQARAVVAIRSLVDELGAMRTPGPRTALVVSHADVIKGILADALGMHLDMIQRIVVDPCSVSVVRYSEQRPFVERMNDSVTPLEALTRSPQSSGHAIVGGGAGK